MNRNQKAILETYKGFLAQNIIWTETLYSYLKSCGLLTESMIHDIKEVEDKYEKINRLIQWLFVREKKHFHSLCDVLQLAGHSFVADFLREEERSSDVIDTKALFEILPSLEKCLGQQQRAEVEHFIKQKVKELKFRGLWKERNTEKEKTLETKNLQLEQSYDYQVALKSKESEISDLRDEIKSRDQEKDRLGKEINELKKEVKSVQIRCNGEKELQLRHNEASESSLKRLGEQLEYFKSLIRTTQQQISSILQLPSRSCDKDLVAMMENEFAFFSDDFNKFLQRFRDLEEFQKEYHLLRTEKDWVLTHLGFNPSDESTPTLTQAYREFAVRTDDHIAKLKRDVSIKRKVLREQEAEIQKLSDEKNIVKDKPLSKTINHWQRFALELLYRQIRSDEDDNLETSKLTNQTIEDNTTLNDFEIGAITSPGQISKEYIDRTSSKLIAEANKEEDGQVENTPAQTKATTPEEVIVTPGKFETTPLLVQNVPILTNHTRPFSKQANPKVSNAKTKNSPRSPEAGLGRGLTASSVKMVTRHNSRKRIL